MRNIRFAGQMTFSEYKQIQYKLFRKFWLVIGISYIILTAFIVAGRDWRTLFTNSLEFISSGLPIVLLWLFLPVFYFLRNFMVRRYWIKNKILHYPITGVITDEGITWNVEKFVSHRISWNLLLKYRFSESLVLVYSSSNQGYFFLRRYFANDADWKSFQEIIMSKLPRK